VGGGTGVFLFLNPIHLFLCQSSIFSSSPAKGTAGRFDVLDLLHSGRPLNRMAIGGEKEFLYGLLDEFIFSIFQQVMAIRMCCAV
jgi:hypothetical protein